MAGESTSVQANQEAARDNRLLTSDPTSVPLSDCINQGLAMLLRAYRYAESVGRNVWDFAVEIDRLRDLGLGDCDFRLLAILKLTAHAQEITRMEDDGREFRSVGNLSFPPRSCFVLTPAGVAQSERELARLEEPVVSASPLTPSNGRPSPQAKPAWNFEVRKLLVAGELVKHFRWPAVNQERILAAFEEEGWPARIDDPLPPESNIDPKRRLHDTIKNLNKNQCQRLLHFRGDGTGEGVIWEWHPAAPPGR